MHHPRTVSSVWHFRFSAGMIVVNAALGLAAVGILGFSLLQNDPWWMVVGATLIPLGVISVLVQWGMASHTGCPLCRTPVLAPKRCAKHRKARTFAGSHRLRVALSILLRDRFRCPYCNESTAVECREKLSHSHPRTRSVD